MRYARNAKSTSNKHAVVKKGVIRWKMLGKQRRLRIMKIQRTRKNLKKKANIQERSNCQVSCANPECVNCDNYKKHISKTEEVREAYKKDKSRVHDLSMQSDLDKSEVYLSSDMQKVILLPRLPGFKLCLYKATYRNTMA